MAKEKEGTAHEEELLVLHEKWVKAAREHLKEIIIASVALVLLAALWSGVKYYFKNRENKASLLYAHAVMVKDEAQREKILKEVVKRYGGTTPALEARLSLYEISIERGNYEEAQKELSYLRGKAREPWRVFVEMGLGYLAEDGKKYEQARKSYEKGAEAGVGIESVAYLDLARVYELSGDYAKAVEYYQKFVATNPQGEILDFVEAHLARLAEKVKKEGG